MLLVWKHHINMLKISQIKRMALKTRKYTSLKKEVRNNKYVLHSGND